MEPKQLLYQALCQATGKEQLSDAEIHKIALFLQGRLRQPGDAADLSLRELVHINPDIK